MLVAVASLDLPALQVLVGLLAFAVSSVDYMDICDGANVGAYVVGRYVMELGGLLEMVEQERSSWRSVVVGKLSVIPTGSKCSVVAQSCFAYLIRSVVALVASFVEQMAPTQLPMEPSVLLHRSDVGTSTVALAASAVEKMEQAELPMEPSVLAFAASVVEKMAPTSLPMEPSVLAHRSAEM